MSERSNSSIEDLYWEKLGPVSPFSAERLEFVLNQVEAADELENDLEWNTEVVDGLTVEELLGGLGEAKHLLETSKEMQRDRQEY